MKSRLGLAYAGSNPAHYFLLTKSKAHFLIKIKIKKFRGNMQNTTILSRAEAMGAYS